MKLRSPAEIRRDAALKRQLDVTTERIRSARVIARALVAKESDMGITGADSLAATLRERIAGSKTKIAGLHERMNTTLAKGDALAVQAEAIVAAVEAEHAQLEAELRQLSNFPPAAESDQKQGGS